MASTDFTNSKYYTLFINNESNLFYWLSSRCVDCGSGITWYSARQVYYGKITNQVMFFSNDGDTRGDNSALRPVISLESNVQLSGNSTDGWTIN